MSIEELYTLCKELREFLLSSVSKNGGHLASNLGVVEIIVAIHNIFDTSRDRLVFDVGHQCYAHKILTGRRDVFNTLRTLGGISGFPNPEESEHDAFISGHASTSVSVALGMARARTALEEDYSVIALIGDGALTGGLAYEGLSDAGQSGEPLIIILNDNEMSITENVGGLSMHLAQLRTRRYYLSVKKIYRKTVAKIPFFGKWLTHFLQSIKLSLKDALRLPSSMFENMGFLYLGPADGHNIKEICRLLNVARDIAQPVVIHLKTTKGKGYKYAEEKPEVFHGVQGFDVKNGRPDPLLCETFAMALGDSLTKLAMADRRICAITAAMKSGTGLDGYARHLPEQFYDVGIAEGHAAAMAGGLAKQGMLPVCALYSTFIQRAYDMLFHDVCLSGLHVVFIIDRAGFVADDGPTHQGTYDVGILLQMPGMTVLCPSAVAELPEMLRYAIYEIKGPVAIRYPRGCCGYKATSMPPYEPVFVRPGKDAAIVTYGRLTEYATAAAVLLEEQGIYASIVKITNISALGIKELTPLVSGVKNVFVAEECVQAGSLASKLALEAMEKNADFKVIPLNIGDALPPPGTTEELLKMYGLDADGIARNVTEYIRQ